MSSHRANNQQTLFVNTRTLSLGEVGEAIERIGKRGRNWNNADAQMMGYRNTHTRKKNEAAVSVDVDCKADIAGTLSTAPRRVPLGARG